MRSRAFQCDGEELYLVEGHYRVVPWDRLGEFAETAFDVTVGETAVVDVREQ